jgi:protoporphyrinogen/coproporphyrinogen III oxidase
LRPDPIDSRPTVAVIGGGIAGLAAAWALSRSPEPPRVVVLEASGRLGGKILTGSLAGATVELGPDAFLARVPWGAELCAELGLGDELVSPAAGHAYLWTRGQLRRIPEGLVLGVPSDLRTLSGSGTVSRTALARAWLDLVLPATRSEGDRSVGEIVTARFGRGIQEWLVDPLVGGIHAGRSELLSAAATAPQLDAAARSGRSLVKALRAQSEASRSAAAAAAPASGTGQTAGPPPVFFTHRRGLGHVVEVLAGRLRDGRVEIRLHAGVDSLDQDGAGWRVGLAGGGGVLEVGAVVLATPAPASAALLGEICPAAAGELAGIEHSSVAVVTLAYRDDALSRPLDGSGFLVPRPQGRLMTAATWMTAKWAHVVPSQGVLIRVSAGRHRDERARGMHDDELVQALTRELGEAMGMRQPPYESLVTRWDDAFPQYAVGHLEMVDRIETAALAVPGLTLAGAAYRGVGIPACINSGRQAAHRVLAHLGAPAAA